MARHRDTREPPALSFASHERPILEVRKGPSWYRRPGLWLIVGAFLLFNLNLSYGGCADDRPLRLAPLSLVRHGTITMDPYAHLFTTDGEVTHHAVVESQGHLVSIYPPAAGVLAVPVFLVPALVWQELPLFLLGKIAASAMAALSVGLVFASARRLGAPVRLGALLSGVYALATPVHSVASRSLCQHPAATLAVAATAYCAIRARQRGAGWAALAGLAAGCAVSIRPQTAVLVAPLCALLLWELASERLAIVSAGLAGALPSIAANLVVSDRLTGPYALAVDRDPAVYFGANPWDGFTGLLFSPGRGLLPFVPVAVFAFWGAARAIRARDRPLVAMVIGVAATIALYSTFSTWWGGHTYGPRYLIETMPFLTLLFIPLFRAPSPVARRPAWGWAFLYLAALSVFIQIVGAFGYPCSWDTTPERPARFWNWTDTPISRCLNDGLELRWGNLSQVTDGLEDG